MKASAQAAELGRSRWADEERLIVRQMAKLTSEPANEGRAIREVLHLMSELVGLNRGRVLLHDETRGEITVRYFYGLTRAQAARGRFTIGDGITGKAFASGRVAIVQDIDSEPEYLTRTVARVDLPPETVSYIVVPFEIEGRTAGLLAAHRLRRRDRALADDLDLMQMIANWVAQVLTVNRLVARHTMALQVENRQLRAQLKQRSATAAIIGGSAILQSALKQVEQVAPSDATVLLLGESGTGKELFAHALHSGSPRRDAPFIKVNCGAIPESLFESELFGHEKGAFTGALTRRIGRIEQAHTGTLFLDEIGDLPLPMQVKLLRVLQDRVIERVGGSSEVAINIRVVAATHRELPELVARQLFRLDLYYRISVVPIRLPALRERTDDLPLLIWHHLAQINQVYGKQSSISAAAIRALTTYHWPGNVRQLRNAIERLVLLCDMPSAHAPAIDVADVQSLLASSAQPELMSPALMSTAAMTAMAAMTPTAISSLSERLFNSGVSATNSTSATQIVNAIAQSGGNKSRAAQVLGLTLRQLNYRLQKLQSRG